MVMKRPFSFAVDASLGKLGRHLRASGFDTVCEHQHEGKAFWHSIGPQRIILTRTGAVQQRCRHHPHLFIRHNDPWRQLLQVVRELGIAQEDVHPFSRCLACNCRIRSVVRETIRGRVPEFIWQRQSSFQACHRCQRVYWAGSHGQRMQRRLASLFSTNESVIHE